MGCGKSKQAVAIVDNTAVLSRKKSSSRSQSLRDVERNHNVTAGTNESIPTNNDDGNKSNGNDGADRNDSINTSNNGNVASKVKQEEKENIASSSIDVHASDDDVKSDIEAKTEEVQEESREGKESNKIEEVIELDNDDGKSDKFESDTPSNGAPKEDSVAENVEVDDAVVEEEKNGGETKEKVANEDADTEEEFKEVQSPETDTASTPEDKPQPESSSSIEVADTN